MSFGRMMSRRDRAMAACPQSSKHTKEPPNLGYVGWHEWAEKKSKTHQQIRCEGCGLFVIWTRKPRQDKEASS